VATRSAHLPSIAAEHQRVVDTHFGARATEWKTLYDEQTLWGAIHRRRRALALDWIDGLGLPPGAQVLEVGCGAGLLAIDLARRGLRVECIDVVPAMVELAEREATAAGFAARVRPCIGDAHALRFERGAFDVVVALGVLPYLHSPAVALREIARVLAPGGHVVLSSDNRWRLQHVLDPRFTPVLGPLKAVVRGTLGTLGVRVGGFPSHLFSARVVRRLHADAGLAVVREVGIGFGPFSLLGRRVLGEAVALRLDARLQVLADRGTPVLRATGAQHLLLSRHTQPIH